MPGAETAQREPRPTHADAVAGHLAALQKLTNEKLFEAYENAADEGFGSGMTAI